MHDSCLAEHIGRYSSLSDDERAVLAAAEIGRRQVRRGTVIRAERGPCDEMFVVASGWLFCSTLLEDGQRQIIRFHFRGDLLGGDSLCFSETPDAVTALTDAEICLIDHAAFGRIFVEHPRLAALLYAQLQIERVMLMDRLTSLGRSSAKGRVAALLLWIAGRLRTTDPACGYSFTLPMTQEEIGDATGLTAVHVNRTLRALEEQGLIERTRNSISLIDPDRLAIVANRPVRRERMEQDWLPPARVDESSIQLT